MTVAVYFKLMYIGALTVLLLHLDFLGEKIKCSPRRVQRNLFNIKQTFFNLIPTLPFLAQNVTVKLVKISSFKAQTHNDKSSSSSPEFSLYGDRAE